MNVKILLQYIKYFKTELKMPPLCLRKRLQDEILQCLYVPLMWAYEVEIFVLLNGLKFTIRIGIIKHRQKIGTQGLRKTMAYQYITNAPDKSQALLEVSSQLGHIDLRFTERYACLEKKNIEAGKQRMSFIYDK